MPMKEFFFSKAIDWEPVTVMVYSKWSLTMIHCKFMF